MLDAPHACLAMASSCGLSGVEPAPSLHVVDHVDQCDGRSGAGNADGSHEQLHPGFLVSEDVLDLGSDLRFLRPRSARRGTPDGVGKPALQYQLAFGFPTA